MMRAAVNLALGLALLGSVLAALAMRSDPTQPNYEYMPDMAHSVRGNAYSASPVFADGKTIQAPPEGVIARGHMPVRYGVTPEEAKRAGEELTPPFALDTGAATRGGKVYAAQCAHCHGATGAGDGAVARRGFPPPPPLIAERARTLKDGQMFHIITYGQANMPPHASHVNREDRWKVIAYIRQMQQRAPAPPPPLATKGGKP